MRTVNNAPLLAVLLASVAACSSQRDAAPEIRSVTSVGTITEDESAEVIAIVDHGKGPEHIEAGTLETIEGVVYGSFAKVGDDRWSLSVTWEMINAVTPLSFDGDLDLVAFAEFRSEWDVTTSEQAVLAFSCGNEQACDGACTSLLGDPDNCGECGEVCLGCNGGRCVDLAPCRASSNNLDGDSLDDRCQSIMQGSCNPAPFETYGNAVIVFYGNSQCTGQHLVHTSNDFDCDEALDWPATDWYRVMCSEGS